MYLRSLQGGGEGDGEGGLTALDTPANRLRYLLAHTMGAERAFEFRRYELAGTRGVGREAVPDEVLLSLHLAAKSGDRVGVV
eukprot:1196057-Prorocentrum_minimum.AAC.1